MAGDQADANEAYCSHNHQHEENYGSNGDARKSFEARIANNEVHLMSQFFNIKIRECTNISTHDNIVYRILKQLKMLGIDFDNKIYYVVLLGTHPNN